MTNVTSPERAQQSGANGPEGETTPPSKKGAWKNRVGLTALGLMSLLTTGCVQLTLAWTDLKPRGVTASPPVLGEFNGDAPITSVAEWETSRAPAYRDALEKYVYGAMPRASSTTVLKRTVLDEAAFNGKGKLEEFVVSAEATFGGETVTTRSALGSGGFYVELITPTAASGPSPVILMETFCSRWNVVPHPKVASPVDVEPGPGVPGVGSYIFGRYICTPPIEDILDAGYAIAAIYPSEVVPDRAEAGLSELQRLSAGHADDDTRWGAIAAWGWVFSRAIDALSDHPAIDQDGLVVWGHSRYGKAALVAAAWDDRIDAVIAHQSGTGGASLNVRKAGESVKAITKSYPHWFSKTYAQYAGREEDLPIDQHMLLSLIAPRPVLLGNARRDVWSDPNGAFRAGLGANPAYALYDSKGLDQERLKPFTPSSDIAFWIRPGTHGVVEEDWPAFIEFLDAHLTRDDG